jgi:4'-phosphopantetheinyl transferase
VYEALEQLAAGEAHVYAARVAESLEPPFVQACLRDLRPDELDRFHRYLLDRDRWPFLVARCLVRRALSRYASVAPGEWVFETEASGKPRLAGPEGAPPLTFNISNTIGFVACIVALDRAVGVDVENVDRSSGVLNLADRCLAPGELRRVRSLPPALRVRGFLEHWTLKEAYVKARGTGLSVAPELVSFEIGGASVQLFLDPRTGDRADRWEVYQASPTDVHILAAAMERPRGGPPSIRLMGEALALG